MRSLILGLAFALAAGQAGAVDPDALDALRGGTPVGEESEPAPIHGVENKDVRRRRSYPMQPPTIPHAIDNYQLDRNANRCMMCHSVSTAAQFQAPPVSVTHYMDRHDNFLAAISPRRYFCTQCHVVQTEAKPLVINGFVDIEALLQRAPAPGH
ncbi:nitrate reductase cytochrome c-type subunit [Tahibacter amnicola]|uniref:Periplasmic nitrate reductase, electron transfer subunit n=1 Tax=Tahibacter amnicola TaxID=2976241 RepID=A0ABY6BNF7_9GAMM|nr:nitrate reductase cytochrome c-type subunit [Tahibacter amnicola]UXI70595.1 nitrate reductase cytochrome c-type subunit [Tahibacter amnicola]